MALRLSPGSMGNRISAARDLAAHPRLLDLVTSAAISWWAARLVVREVCDLESEQAERVVDVVCGRIAERRNSGRRAWTSAGVGRAARIARQWICGEADRTARQRAVAGRRDQLFGGRQGMACLVAHLGETDAHRIHRRLSAIAHGLDDDSDPRTCDQLRADVFVDVLLGAPSSLPGAPGQPRTAGDGPNADPPNREHAQGQAGSRPYALDPQPRCNRPWPLPSNHITPSAQPPQHSAGDGERQPASPSPTTPIPRSNNQPDPVVERPPRPHSRSQPGGRGQAGGAGWSAMTATTTSAAPRVAALARGPARARRRPSRPSRAVASSRTPQVHRRER